MYFDMSYRDKYIDKKEYKNLLDYYEILLFNNHTFFLGLNLYEAINIKRIQRIEFDKYEEDNFIDTDVLKKLDCAIKELEIEDYKIIQIEEKIIHRFLVNRKNDTNNKLMKASKLKNMCIGLIMYIRSLFSETTTKTNN